MDKLFHYFLLASPWGALERLWGPSVGYAGSGEPLYLPALLRVPLVSALALPPPALWSRLAPLCRGL